MYDFRNREKKFERPTASRKDLSYPSGDPHGSLHAGNGESYGGAQPLAFLRLCFPVVWKELVNVAIRVSWDSDEQVAEIDKGVKLVAFSTLG